MHPTRKILPPLVSVLLFLIACNLATPTPKPAQVIDEVATSVAMTLTAIPSATATETPLPVPPEAASPSPTFVIPTFPAISLTPTIIATSKPAYSCDIINQRPYDDTKLHPNQPFTIKWTLVNNGTLKWEPGTTLAYSDGPHMTSATSFELHKLKPGEQYEMIISGVAPAEKGTQIMVWVVYGPGAAGDKTIHYMCYPYVRIIVAK